MVRAGEKEGAGKSHWRGVMISRGWTPLFLRIVRLFMIASREGEGDPLVHDRGRPETVRPGCGASPASQETCHAFGRKPINGEIPAASTEVVMALKSFLRSHRANVSLCSPVALGADLRSFA